MKPTLLGVTAVGLLAWSPASAPAADFDVPEIRISVELIQVDAVVTDRAGVPVTDLGVEDFELREEGRPQAITHLAYVRAGQPWTWRAAPDGAVPAPAAAQPRTLVVLFDDLGLSPEGSTWARRALLQVAARLLPTDRIAVVTTSGWEGELDLTSEPQAVAAAIRSLRYDPWARDAARFRRPVRSARPVEPGAPELDRNWDTGMRSLHALRGVIEALDEVGGRKAVLLVSEGFAEITSVEQYLDAHPWASDFPYDVSYDAEDALRQLGDLATRASVVIHAVDPRGLIVSPVAGGAAAGSAPGVVSLASALADAGGPRRASQASLEYLPRETGGMAIVDQNDLEGAVDRVLDTLSGYYLIGYAPGPATFEKPRAFREIDVRVKGRGLRVHSRRGFYGFASAAPAP